MIQDLYRILSIFRKVPRIVSCDKVEIRNIIPLVFALEHTLCDVIDQALEAQHQEEAEE